MEGLYKDTESNSDSKVERGKNVGNYSLEQEEKRYLEAMEIMEVIPFHVTSVIQGRTLQTSLENILKITENPTFEIPNVLNQMELMTSIADIISVDACNCTDICLDILSNIWSSPYVTGTVFLEPYLCIKIVERFDNESTTIETQRKIIQALCNAIKVNNDMRNGLLSLNILEKINIFMQTTSSNENNITALDFINSVINNGTDDIEDNLEQFLPHIVNLCSNENTEIRMSSLLILKKMLKTESVFQMAAQNGVHKNLVSLSQFNNVKFNTILMECVLLFIDKGYHKAFASPVFLHSIETYIEFSSAFDDKNISKALLVAWYLTDKYWERMERIGIYNSIISHLHSVLFTNKIMSVKVLLKYLNLCQTEVFAHLIFDKEILEPIVSVADSLKLLSMMDFLGVLIRMCEYSDTSMDILNDLEVPDIIDDNCSDFESEDIDALVAKLKTFFIDEED